MPIQFRSLRSGLALLLGFFISAASAAELDVLSVEGVKLRDNPLGDRIARRLGIFAPDKTPDDAKLPMVIYLPGWGGSSEDAIKGGAQSLYGEVIDELANSDQRVRIAVVDGRSRYGGSQFLNSNATGNYADYVADEIVAGLEKQYGCSQWIISGHSSGGYGALMLAMNHQERFSAVVALSPDSDFETTHKPLVQNPDVRAVTRADLELAMASKDFRMPGDWMVKLIMGLCANYTPTKTPGQFEWLYNEKGEWREDVWQRWLEADPLTVVGKKENAFSAKQLIYLDGAEKDEFGANIGARKIYAILRNRAILGRVKTQATFYESPGHHGDIMKERMVKGLKWVLR